jgi:hypothetical protein
MSRPSSRCACGRGLAAHWKFCPFCGAPSPAPPAPVLPSPELLDPPGYAKRVRELEAEGMTTSDAQAVADAEILKRG